MNRIVMNFPKRKEIDSVLKELEGVEPALAIDYAKAPRSDVVNKIVLHKIDTFTIDRLVDLLSLLKPVKLSFKAG